MNIVKNIFIGTKAYTDATTWVNQAIDTYTSTIIDLGTALNIKLLEETKAIQGSILDASRHIEDMSDSITSESHFQSLRVEMQQSSSGIDRFLQARIGIYLL